MGDPFDPLGPERPNRDVPPAEAAGDARPHRVDLGSDAPAQPSRLLSAGRLTRLDEEIEALRRNPGPTQSRGRTTPPQEERVAPLDRVNSFLDGVAFMGIFSRTRDIIAANFNELLDKADDPEKMIRMIIFEMEETNTENKIPLLGDVPVLGHLFKSRVRESQKREMLVFITPKMLADIRSAR